MADNFSGGEKSAPELKMAANVGKVSTCLTRMAVATNPHHTLGVLYSKSLRALAKMPADYAYRKHAEQLINERAEMVKLTPDVAELEQKVGCGQIEEVIVQAENELRLCRRVLEWRSWEPLASEPPPNQWKWPM